MGVVSVPHVGHFVIFAVQNPMVCSSAPEESYSIRFHAVLLQHLTLQMDIKEYNNNNKQNTNTMVQLFTNIHSKAMWNQLTPPSLEPLQEGLMEDSVAGFCQH